MTDSLGDRMKGYENVTRYKLYRRTPVIIRVDGKAFHTFTRNMNKPFDRVFMATMLDAAKKAAEGMQGFKIGYVQSDEASFLLTDYDELNTQPWLGNNLLKIVSISAAAMTSYFGRFYQSNFPIFDARAFNLPKEEVSNYFVWRAKDWFRNSVNMFAQSKFSHDQLQGKSIPEIHEMLHGIGSNWSTECNLQEKNGAFFTKDNAYVGIAPNFASIDALVSPFLLEKTNG